MVLKFCIRKNKFKNLNICDGLMLKRVQNDISSSKAEISYYSVCIFRNVLVFYKSWRCLNCDGNTILGKIWYF